MATEIETDKKLLQAFDEALERDCLEGHWRLGTSLTPEPAAASLPHVWRWDMVYDHLMRAGELLGMETGAARRTLRLCAPGLPIKATTPTFQTSIQLVKPGEIAEAHRHTMTAFRFVLEGSGGFTTVEGEKFGMDPYDLVLTPQWLWHDHGNETEGPMIWLDGHDQPFVQALNVCFFQPFNAPQQDVRHPNGYHNRRAGTLRPRGAHPSAAEAGVPYIYKGRDALAMLDELGEGDLDPCDGHTLEYLNPATGGPTLATIACRLHRLSPTERTRWRRHTASSVYHVIEGSGETTAGDERLVWGPGDTFLVPNWAWHRHRVTGGKRAVLFSVRDDPILKPFGLYRCEEANSRP